MLFKAYVRLIVYIWLGIMTLRLKSEIIMVLLVVGYALESCIKITKKKDKSVLKKLLISEGN